MQVRPQPLHGEGLLAGPQIQVRSTRPAQALASGERHPLSRFRRNHPVDSYPVITRDVFSLTA
jgi:hypothetical protein